MPFVAYLGDRRVDADAMTPTSWVALKADPAREQLVLPQCGVRAVAKTSRRGRQFFAHHRESSCALPHSAESEAHRVLKSALAARINATAGWRAVIEYTEDRSWITDVMALSRHGQRIAFEVQLSTQTEEGYAARTQRYFDAGVGPVWVVPAGLAELDLQVPYLTCGITKSTPVPEDPDRLLGHTAYQWLLGEVLDTGAAIERVLAGRFTWRHSDPRTQWPDVLERRRRRQEEDQRAREARAQKETAKRQASGEAAEAFRALVDAAEKRRSEYRAWVQQGPR